MTDLIAGVALILAACFLALREILLSPKTKGWPPAPTVVRVSIILLMGALFYQGMSLTGLFFSKDITVAALFGSDIPGKVSGPGAVMCWTILFYSAVTCINVARQFYPAAVWRRVERILTLAECKNALVLIQLTRRGIYVFFPNRKDDPEPIGEVDIVDLPPKLS